MRWHKHLLKNQVIVKMVGWLGSRYIRFIFKTTRWTFEGSQHPQPFWDQEKPFICAFWHNRLLLGTYGWTVSVPFYMLISEHADGQVIAHTVKHQGIDCIAGSKRRGGMAAFRRLVHALRQGQFIGMTPDGPRGPRFKASPGIATLARLTGVPVLPFVAAVEKRVVLSTWDRFIIPLPFGKGIVAWGEPVYSLPDEGDEAHAQRIEQALNTLTKKMDQRCGHIPLT
jgi:lysophospholipid acyltransferase (LPLAT)-like uncharacterized protein